jgi:hypothetical protein
VYVGGFLHLLDVDGPRQYVDGDDFADLLAVMADNFTPPNICLLFLEVVAILSEFSAVPLQFPQVLDRRRQIAH